MIGTQCLFPECKDKAFVRGLCGRHYRSVHRYVKLKKFTWKELEKAGKCLPAIPVNLRHTSGSWSWWNDGKD